jgi:hypothetical protein
LAAVVGYAFTFPPFPTSPSISNFVNFLDENAGHPGWGMGEMKDVKEALWNTWVLNRDDLAKINN